MNKHIILKIMVDVILGRKCSRLGGKVALIIVFSLLILVSCSSKEDDSQAEVDQQQTSQQLQLIDQLVCDTIIELPTAARKPFRSHFITMVRVEGVGLHSEIANTAFSIIGLARRWTCLRFTSANMKLPKRYGSR